MSGKQSKVLISYRDEGNGAGPFYDHYSIQRATRHETAITVSANMNTVALWANTRTVTHSLPYGVPSPDALGKLVPEVLSMSSPSTGLK